MAAAALLSVSASGGAFAQKTLNIGMAAADVGQLDPHKATTTQDKPVVAWIFNGLVRLKPGSAKLEDIEPDLAEKWTASDDKLTWTFTLRKGVKFHGSYGELTSEDAVYSLQRAANSKTSSFSGDYASVEAITAPDPNTVVIKLKSPIPSLLGIVANYHGGNIVSKKAAEERGDNFRINPIGTGPFAVEGYKPNESVTLTAHAGYFRGKPKIDRIVYRFIPSDSSRDLAFEAGELDLIYGRQDQLWVERMKKKPGVIVEAVPPGELAMISLNMSQKPLDGIAWPLDKDMRVPKIGLVSCSPSVQEPTGTNKPLFAGFDSLLRKAMLTPKIISGTCTPTVSEWNRTTPRPFAGIGWLSSKAMLAPNSSSGSCTLMVEA